MIKFLKLCKIFTSHVQSLKSHFRENFLNKYLMFMDQTKLKNVYDKNRELILVLYSVFTVWQFLHNCMLIQNTLIFIFSIDKFSILFIHVFDLRLVHENQISTLFPKQTFPKLRFE